MRGPARSFVRVLFVIVGALVLIPLLLLLAYAFRDAPLYDPTGSWSFASWAIVWGRGALELLTRTGVFVVMTLVVGAVLSLPSAWLLERTSIHGRRLWRALIIASMALAPGVLAFSWVLLARRDSGALSQLLEKIPVLGPYLGVDVQTVIGMGFVGGLAVTSTAYTMVAPSFRMIGGDMEDASYMSGAGPAETVRRIVAPLARPAITGALLIMAIIMLGSLEVPAIVGSVPGVSVFADRIFRELQPQMGLPSHNTAAVLGVMLLAVALALLALYQRAHRQSKRYAVVVGRGYATRRMKLGRWEIAAQAYLLVVVALILVLPALMLFWASITPFYRVPTAPNAFNGLSTTVYASLAGAPGIGTAVLNSIQVVIAGASLAMLLGALVAWVNVRVKTRAAYYLGTLAFVPIGIPTVLVAISVFLTFLYVPIG